MFKAGLLVLHCVVHLIFYFDSIRFYIVYFLIFFYFIINSPKIVGVYAVVYI